MPTDSPLDSLPSNEWDALIFSIIKPLLPLCRKDPSISPEDLQQEAWIGLLTASERYDPNKAKFTTFAYHYIRGSVMSFIAKRTKNKPHQVIDDPSILDCKSYVDTSLEKKDVMETILEKIADQKHVDLLREHFVYDKSFRQIAKEQGVSHEAIANRIHKLLDTLQMRMNHENS